MSVKRLRIFAGPNGSGKSTLINKLQKNPPSSNFKLGYYVNADDIEKELNKNARIDFNIYGINSTTKQIQSYFKKSSFSPVKTSNPELWRIFTISENGLTISDKGMINSYVAADLAEFIRQQIMNEAHSFTYEIAMFPKHKH
jgi:predicted ABC-type ATPase